MLNYNSSIKKAKSYIGLTIKEIYPIMKLNVRGKSRDFLSTNARNWREIIGKGREVWVVSDLASFRICDNFGQTEYLGLTHNFFFDK